MRYSPDENLIVTATNDGAVRIWNPLAPMTALRTCKNNDTANGAGKISVPRSGSRILHYVDSSLTRLWNIDDCHETPIAMGQTFDQAFSPNGQLIAIGRSGGNAQILDAITGVTLKTLKHSAPIDREDMDVLIEKVLFSPDGRLLATVDNVGTIKIWQCDDWALVHEFRHPTWGIADIAFDSFSRRLASSDEAGNVFVWNIDTGAKVFI